MSNNKPLYRNKIAEEVRLYIIPVGEYDVMLHCWGHQVTYNTPKLVMLWKITTPGEHIGKLIPRYYNLSSWDSKTRTPIPAGMSLYAAHYRQFHGNPRSKRGYNPEDFSNQVYRVKVELSDRDGRKKLKPKEFHYSEIKDILSEVA